MIESILQNEGWLFQLSSAQYLLMLGLVMITIVFWILIGKIFRESEKFFSIFSKWGIRLGILILAWIGVLIVADLTVREFFSMPVLVLFNEVSISPLLVVFIIVGVYILSFLNIFLKGAVKKITQKYGIDRKAGKQVRYLVMIFAFILVASVWLNFAGEYLLGFFNDKLFPIGDIKITPGILIYSILIIYGIAVALKIIEVIYTRHTAKKGISSGQSQSVFQILKYLIWLIAVLLLLDSIGVSYPQRDLHLKSGFVK